MTFVEAAIEILKREGRPLHVKKLTELAIARNLLSLVGKDPEGQMQARLSAELKKTTGDTPLTRGASAGTFGLKVYPPRSARPAEKEAPVAKEKDKEKDEPAKKKKAAKSEPKGKAKAPAKAKTRAAKAKPAPEVEVEEAPAEAAAPEMIDLDLDAEPGAEAPEAPAEAAASRERTGRRRHRGGRGGRSEPPPDLADAPARADAPGGEARPEERPPSRPPVTMSFDDAMVRVRPPGSPQPVQSNYVPSGQGRSLAASAAANAAAQAFVQAQPAPAYAAAAAALAAGPDDPTPTFGVPSFREPLPPAPAPAESPADPGVFADAEAGAAIAEKALQTPVSAPEGVPGEPPRRQPEVVHMTRPDTGGFRSVPLADAAYEVLRTQGDGRPVHYRQIADMAVKRRLVRPDAPDVWRALRAAMLQESRDRQSQGLRPRIRHHGNGLFALATRRLEPELMSAEKELTGKHAELRALTRIALRRRLGRLPPTAFEHLVRVLLERVGYSEMANVKRGDGVAYYSAVLARGALPVRVLIGIRAGEQDLGRRAVGELRTGVRVKQLEEALLIGAGRLMPDGVAEARAGLAQGAAAVTAIDGDALADLLIRHGVGVLRVTLPVEYLDPELFADLSEG